MRYASVFLSLLVSALSYGQTDTLYYDPASGNYIIRYLGTTAGNQDTMVTLVYEPPTKIDPKIECFVWPSPDAKYLYRYRITNGSQAQQNLNEFSLHYDSTVWIESRTPETSWRNYSRSIRDYSSLDNPKRIHSWVWNGDQGLEATWYIDSCIIASDGLPSITDSYTQAKTRIWAWPAGGPNQKDTLASDIRFWLLELEVYPNANVLRKTIGPKLPPTLFSALGFLDTIKSYITQSRTLGWITTQGSANKYTALVDSAQANLSASPTRRGVAKAKLDSVLVNANVDSSTTLTSEAYALIRFNTEYVLQKLREEDSAFAAGNESSSWDATATNNARHLAKSDSYLHEVFTSGGEIFYRRSADGGSTWDQTHQINIAFGENDHPSVATTQSGSVQVVWQRRIAPSTYEVLHSYSLNDGETWSTSAVLPDADQVAVSNYQTEGIMPVIIERRQNVLVLVYCSDDGLRYRTSSDDGQNWQVPSPDIISGQYDDRVRFPSLASDGSSAWLVYDYVNDASGPYSRTFDGSTWSDETTIATGTDTDNGAFSSIAIDPDGYPIAAWSASSMNLSWGRAIVVCLGYPDNKWSKWFTLFGQNFIDWSNPSVTYYDRDGHGLYGIAVVNHTSQNRVKQIQLQELEPPTWDISTLSESGVWASLTQENSSSGTPIHCWTDQSSSPYEIMVGSSGARPLLSPATLRHTRAAVVRRKDATLTLEFEPMRIVLANGDTSVVPFKASSLRQREKINFSNMWDYLGSDVMSVPPNARRLVVSKQFGLRGPSIAQRKFSLRLLNSRGTSLAVLDTTSTSGTVSVNITPYAGMSVMFRPQLVLVGIEPSSLDIGVGDVFIAPNTGSTPMREGKNR